MKRNELLLDYNTMLQAIRPYVKKLPRKITRNTAPSKKGQVTKYFELLFGLKYTRKKGKAWEWTGNAPLVTSRTNQSVKRTKGGEDFLLQSGRLGKRKNLKGFPMLERLPIPSGKLGKETVVSREFGLQWKSENRIKTYVRARFYYKNGKPGTLPYIRQEVREKAAPWMKKGEFKKNVDLTIAVGAGEEGGSRLRDGLKKGSFPSTRFEDFCQRVYQYIRKVLNDYNRSDFIHGFFVYEVTTKGKKRAKKKKTGLSRTEITKRLRGVKTNNRARR